MSVNSGAPSAGATSTAVVPGAPAPATAMQATTPEVHEPAAPARTDTHAAALGARLRRIRHQQGLSLADVEELSGGEWKAVVVGAYERGDRAISMERLARLAAFYGVPVSGLLPTRRLVADDGSPTVVLDLTRLDAPELEPVARFAANISQVRGDHNGRLLTLRGGDLDTLALAVGRHPGELRSTLDRHGVLVPPRHVHAR